MDHTVGIPSRISTPAHRYEGSPPSGRLRGLLASKHGTDLHDDDLLESRTQTKPDGRGVYHVLVRWADSRGCRRCCFFVPLLRVLLNGSQVHINGTGMPDEQDYTSHLCTYEDAKILLTDPEDIILEYAWRSYLNSIDIDIEASRATRRRQSTSTPQ